MIFSGVTNRIVSWPAKIILASQLGHGRATEFLLSGMAGSYGLALLFFPSLGFESQATRHVFWQGQGVYVVIGLLTKAILSSWGLLANIRSWPYERSIRFIGAFIGAIVWLWFLFQFSFLSAVGAFGTFACFWFFVFSIRAMGMAIIGLPAPGSPGRL